MKTARNWRTLTLQTSLQAVAITIKSPINLTLCTLYLHHTDQITEFSRDHLINQLPYRFLISGDFNAHNSLWGSTFTNDRGRNIEKFIDRHSLTLLNNGAKTHFTSPNGNFSAIDVTICSNTLAPLVHWDTLPSLFGSDHFPLLISIQTYVDFNQTKKYPSWRFKDANWTRFTNSVKLKLPENCTDANVMNKQIINQIISAADQNIPKNSAHITKKQTVWWNNDCKLAITKKKTVFLPW